MKRLTMIVALAALALGTATAQEQGQTSDDMTQKRTEMVAKKYGLDDDQTAKLLELNKKYADMMMPRGGGRAPMPMREGGERPRPEMGDSARRQRPEMTEEQRAEMQKNMEEMKATMEAYDKELQEIMTADQYEAYKADQEKGRRGRD